MISKRSTPGTSESERPLSQSTSICAYGPVVTASTVPVGLTFTRARGDDRTYRYYTCHRTANQSATDCPVRSLPARVVEGAVIDQLRGMFRAPELVARTLRLPDAHPMVGALASLDPIWENLFPAEQERLVLLLVEKMVVHPDHLEMVLSRDGLRALVAEMDAEGGRHAPVHCVA